jgi:hypothetical protein
MGWVLAPFLFLVFCTAAAADVLPHSSDARRLRQTLNRASIAVTVGGATTH